MRSVDAFKPRPVLEGVLLFFARSRDEAEGVLKNMEGMPHEATMSRGAGSFFAADTIICIEKSGSVSIYIASSDDSQ